MLNKHKTEYDIKNYPVPQRFNTVVKANDLIQKSRFNLSTQQQKIVLFIISQIERTDEEFKLYTFKITEFCKLCGIEPKGDNYNFLKEQIKKICDKSLYILDENGIETLYRWIDKPFFDKRKGTIQIKLDEQMKPYLLQLKERFTEYELIYTLNFKSKYSIRLYEYLKSIHFDKMKEYTQYFEIEHFQAIFNSEYTTFKSFHTRVLQPAYKEINEFSDIHFEYELIKEGKKVKSILITIQPKDTLEKMRQTLDNEKMLDEGIKNEW